MKIFFNNCNTGGYPDDVYCIWEQRISLHCMLARLVRIGTKHIHLNYFYDHILVRMVDRQKSW